MVEQSSKHFDAVIGGGGPTGLATALSLANIFDGDVELAIVEPGHPAGNAADPRAWALSAASIRLLKSIGLWSRIEPSAQVVGTIEITDSPLEAGIRPVLLSYDNASKGGEPASYIVPNQALLEALSGAVQHTSCIQTIPGRIEEFRHSASSVAVTLDNGHTLSADLLIAADGRSSGIREMAGINSIQWAYDQLGIVTTVAHDRPHDGKAVQHFLPGGPFAMLPLRGNETCITWSENADTATSIMQLDDDAFLSEVQRRFGGKLGLLSLAGPRLSFPLGMHLARSYIARSLVLVGDAAHGVHPIAGQGLNLAFRDIAVLADCVADGVRSGLAFGDVAILERYQAWRRFDATLSASAFDALNRLFSNDVTLLRSAREVGLGLVDRMPDLKRFFVDEAAGLRGELPRLMRQ